MRIVFYILIILISIGCKETVDTSHPLYNTSNTVKTDKHKRIKGTKVFVILPDSFQYNQKLNRYETPGKQIFKCSKFLTYSWNDVTKNQTFLNDIPMYGYNGNYLETEDSRSKRLNILAQFGGDDFMIRIDARTSTELEGGRAELLKILKSVYYDDKFELDELELAQFTFNRTFANYSLTSATHKYFLFTKINDAFAPQANSISFKTVSPLSDKQFDHILNNIVSKERKRGVKFEGKEIVNKKIGKYDAKILESEIRFQGESGVYYKAIIFDEENAIEITATGHEDIEELKTYFDNTIESIEFR